jgi:VCBS repeat-containing protein
VGTPPTAIELTLSEPVHADSLAITDLTIDGGASVTGVELTDARIVRFLVTVPDISGTYHYALVTGAFLDLQGQPSAAYSASFELLDTTGPVVTGSSIAAGEVLPPGPLTFTASFSEDLATSDLGAEDVTLVEHFSGASIAATSFTYDSTTDQLTVEFPALADGDYTLTLASGATAFRDLVENPLNGAPSFPTPSGQGDPAGDAFVVDFTVRTTEEELGRIAGVKFEDMDGDGVRDTGEPGLTGWVIYLDADRNGQRDETERFTTTGTDGAYSLSGLTPGTYIVAEERQAGWVQTAPAGGTYEVTISSGLVAPGRDFGNFRLGEIHSIKFNDLDADGVRDVGEPGLAGWTVYLDSNRNNALDDSETRITTDATGAYAFTGLGPGTYRVAEVGQPGWELTTPEFSVVLNGTSEVPANVTTGSGFGTFSLQEAMRTLHFELNFAHLQGDTTGLHIHAGAPGVEGPVLYDLAAAAGVGAGFTSPISGTVVLAADHLDELLAGTLYVNLHTTAFAGGEIREQIMPGTAHVVPLTSGLVSTGRDFGNHNLNDAPQAEDDAYSVAEDSVLIVDAPGVLGNDRDADGNALLAVLVEQPVHGTLSLNPDGSFRYAPAADFQGTDRFTYQATDGTASANVAAVAIVVTPVNDAPVARGDTYDLAEDTTLTVAMPGLLGNDTDVDRAVLTASLVSGPASGTLVLNADGAFTYTPHANFFGTDSFSYAASDGNANNTAVVTLQVTAVNDAPQLAAIGNRTVNAGSLLTITVTATDPDSPAEALVFRLDEGAPAGATITPAGVFTWTPTEAQSQHSYPVTVRVSDDGGLEDAEPLTITVIEDKLIVTAFQTTSSGFTVEFSQAFDASSLNLYDAQTGDFGPADVTLVGSTVGPVRGSLVLNAAANTATFIKTGGLLAPDTYTVRLRSATNGFKSLNGNLLDRNDDGSAGDDYLTTFTVAPSSALVLSVPDFARGPGQSVDVPATSVGIPIMLSNGTGVEAVDLSLTYDPALLTITAASPGAALPNGSLVVANLDVPGRVTLSVASVTALGPGPAELVRLTASVPATAPYRAKHILDLTSVAVNEGTLATSVDDGLHVVSYFGDATGTGIYSALDGQRMLRVVAGLDTGLTAFPLVDPVIIGDITGNGALSALDATRILQEAVGLDRPEIPPLPGIIVPLPVADPLVNIPTTLRSTPGGMVTVPVNIDNADGLEAVDLPLAYDTSVLDLAVAGVRTGSVTAGGTLIVNLNEAAGLVRVALAMTTPRPAGGGTLVEFDYQVSPTASLGTTRLDLQSVSLNEGELVLTPAPVPGADPTDGLLTLNTTPVAADDTYSVAEDTTLLVAAPGLLDNDSDADGNPLTAVLVSGPAHGALTLHADGSFLYTPATDFHGLDHFTYRASDGVADSTEATVTITVTPVNDAPAVVDDTYSVAEDTTLLVAAPGLLANDSDVDGDPFTVEQVSGPAHGTLTVSADGSFFYTPAADFYGVDHFTYRTSDGGATSPAATVTIAVTPVNDAPVATDDAYSVAEDRVLLVPAAQGVLGNDTDIDGDPLEAVLVSGATFGTLDLRTDGSFTYSPNANFNGTDSFTYRVSDGTALANEATVRLTVNAVNDPPVQAMPGPQMVDEDTALVFAAARGNGLAITDVDAGSAALQVTLTAVHGAVTLGATAGLVFTLGDGTADSTMVFEGAA